jgi:hypothetical protein
MTNPGTTLIGKPIWYRCRTCGKTLNDRQVAYDSERMTMVHGTDKTSECLGEVDEMTGKYGRVLSHEPIKRAWEIDKEKEGK